MWQKAYEGDAISLADLKAHRARLESEREELQRELERVMHRDEELQRLARTEAEMRKRIEATKNNLAGVSPEERRVLYTNLKTRFFGCPDSSGHLARVSSLEAHPSIAVAPVR